MDSFPDQAALVGQAMGGQAENEAKSNRSKASWQRRHREGKPMSNKSPYGLQLRRERDTEEPITAPWVRQAFEWYASGIGAHTIAKRFQAGAPVHRVVSTRVDQDGNPIIRERAHVFEYNKIIKMLRQRRYRGTIVDPELFDRVQAALKSKPHWRNDRLFDYPLSGAIKCLTCGRSFHGHATGATRKKRRADGTIVIHGRYQRTRYYGCTVCHYMINADRLETWFEESIGNLQANPNIIDRWVGAESRMLENNSLAAERKKLEERLRSGWFDKQRQRAWELALADDAVNVDLPRHLKAISDQEAQCRDRLNELTTALNAALETKRSIELALRLLEDYRKLYRSAPYEQKRELASTLVQALGGARASKDGLVWLREGREKNGEIQSALTGRG